MNWLIDITDPWGSSWSRHVWSVIVPWFGAHQSCSMWCPAKVSHMVTVSCGACLSTVPHVGPVLSAAPERHCWHTSYAHWFTEWVTSTSANEGDQASYLPPIAVRQARSLTGQLRLVCYRCSRHQPRTAVSPIRNTTHCCPQYATPRIAVPNTQHHA